MQPWERLSLSPNRIQRLGNGQPAPSKDFPAFEGGNSLLSAGEVVSGRVRNLGSPMKAIRFSKLTAFARLVTIGLLGVAVARAQAPSGPNREGLPRFALMTTIP
jgi:hypothetical protein